MSQAPDASVSTQPSKLTKKKLPKFSRCKRMTGSQSTKILFHSNEIDHTLIFRINVDFQPNMNCLPQSWQPLCFFTPHLFGFVRWNFVNFLHVSLPISEVIITN